MINFVGPIRGNICGKINLVPKINKFNELQFKIFVDFRTILACI